MPGFTYKSFRQAQKINIKGDDQKCLLYCEDNFNKRVKDKRIFSFTWKKA